MNVDHLMFAAAVTMTVTAIALGIAKRLELGSIVALLIVGMMLGPHSPKPLFTGHIEEMKAVGEIGVMLLMFTIGLDIRPQSLWSMRRWVFGRLPEPRAISAPRVLPPWCSPASSSPAGGWRLSACRWRSARS